jgi:hypothetical protein
VRRSTKALKKELRVGFAADGLVSSGAETKLMYGVGCTNIGYSTAAKVVESTMTIYYNGRRVADIGKCADQYSKGRPVTMYIHPDSHKVIVALYGGSFTGQRIMWTFPGRAALPLHIHASLAEPEAILSNIKWNKPQAMLPYTKWPKEGQNVLWTELRGLRDFPKQHPGVLYGALKKWAEAGDDTFESGFALSSNGLGPDARMSCNKEGNVCGIKFKVAFEKRNSPNKAARIGFSLDPAREDAEMDFGGQFNDDMTFAVVEGGVTKGVFGTYEENDWVSIMVNRFGTVDYMIRRTGSKEYVTVYTSKQSIATAVAYPQVNYKGREASFSNIQYEAIGGLSVNSPLVELTNFNNTEGGRGSVTPLKWQVRNDGSIMWEEDEDKSFYARTGTAKSVYAISKDDPSGIVGVSFKVEDDMNINVFVGLGAKHGFQFNGTQTVTRERNRDIPSGTPSDFAQVFVSEHGVHVDVKANNANKEHIEWTKDSTTMRVILTPDGHVKYVTNNDDD